MPGRSVFRKSIKIALFSSVPKELRLKPKEKAGSVFILRGLMFTI
jgi:hypothetical protein